MIDLDLDAGVYCSITGKRITGSQFVDFYTDKNGNLKIKLKTAVVPKMTEEGFAEEPGSLKDEVVKHIDEYEEEQ